MIDEIPKLPLIGRPCHASFSKKDLLRSHSSSKLLSLFHDPLFSLKHVYDYISLHQIRISLPLEFLFYGDSPRFDSLVSCFRYDLVLSQSCFVQNWFDSHGEEMEEEDHRLVSRLPILQNP